MTRKLNYTTPPPHSFAGLPVCTRLEDLEADIAIVGLHYVSPYPQLVTAETNPSQKKTAPDAIRLQSSVFTDHRHHRPPRPDWRRVKLRATAHFFLSPTATSLLR